MLVRWSKIRLYKKKNIVCSDHQLPVDLVFRSVVAVIEEMSTQTAPTKEEINAIGMSIQTSKMELQRTFATGNIEAIMKKLEEVREAIKRLPEPFASIETVQTLANLATAFLHTGRVQEALDFNNEAVSAAEKLVEMQPNRPEPLDLLSGALGAKVNVNMVVGKLDVAEECAKRAFSIAESIFPKNDVRMSKSLRNLGVVLSRKGENAEAEKYLVRAYTIVCLASGAQSPEAQMLTDDLVNLSTNKEDLEAAEKYARSNFKKVSEISVKNAKDEQILADSGSRLGSVLVKKGNFEEAETLVSQALSLRENNQSENFNPLGIAYSLAQLAGIQEQLGKVTGKTEEMLVRALDIFASSKGQQSAEVNNTLNQLRSVRAKRAEKKKNGEVDEDDDGLAYSVTSENKSSVNGGEKSTAGNGSPRSSSGKLSDPFGLTEQDRNKIASIPAEDGDGRLMAAQMYFQTSKFLAASILLTEAHEIFLKKEGPNGEKTKMSHQNMMVSQMKRIDQLWLSSAREELLRLEEEQTETAVNKKDDDGK